MDAPRYSLRSCLLSIGLILLVVTICSSVTTLAFDANCARIADEWIPPYPNAERISGSYNFLREFGLGTTEVIMTSPDKPTDIQTWYNQDRQRRGISAAGVCVMLR